MIFPSVRSDPITEGRRLGKFTNAVMKMTEGSRQEGSSSSGYRLRLWCGQITFDLYGHLFDLKESAADMMRSVDDWVFKNRPSDDDCPPDEDGAPDRD
jgi:hypothetical protein